MKQIELSAGTIEYSDTGGDRPVLVLLHGLMMDASLWDGPMADLSADHRCVAPTLPLGAVETGRAAAEGWPAWINPASKVGQVAAVKVHPAAASLWLECLGLAAGLAVAWRTEW